MTCMPELIMSNVGLSPVNKMSVVNQDGKSVETSIVCERPLTVRMDSQEIVTLMTIGTNPEDLALGYLRNQRIISDLDLVNSVMVDWMYETVEISTNLKKKPLDRKRNKGRKIITTGCGQGTLFSCSLDKLYDLKFPNVRLRQSDIYQLLKSVSGRNNVYKKAGSVHACALCREDKVLMFEEDVGRHNATDAISGRMWRKNISGNDKILYTTGRLTSEIIIKAAFMGIPVLISRSGATHMGIELSIDLQMTVIGRARGKRFIVFSGHKNIEFDMT
jgi:FdhD protein